MAFTNGLLPDRGLLLEVDFFGQFAPAKFISKVLFSISSFFFVTVSVFASAASFLTFSEAFTETSFSVTLRAFSPGVVKGAGAAALALAFRPATAGLLEVDLLAVLGHAGREVVVSE